MLSPMDFLKALSTAQNLPPSATSVPFDPFAPSVQETKPLVAEAAGPGTIPGVADYNLTYHCKRFIVGKELREIGEKGQKFFDDKDDGDELKLVMDRCLRGEGVIWNRNQSTLGDGTVVVWLEWGEPKAQVPTKPRGERDHLTAAELRSPERMTPTSAARDADPAPDEPTMPDEEDNTPSTNDEPDWE